MATLPPKALRVLPALSSFWDPTGNPWLVAASLQPLPCLHVAVPLSAFSLLIRVLLIGFRAHPNPGDLILVTSAKALLSNKVTC